MRTFTLVLLILTVISGYGAFTYPAAENLKLLYAYFALTTIVCGMLSFAIGHAAARSGAVKAVACSEAS